jgi:hypothetical protein
MGEVTLSSVVTVDHLVELASADRDHFYELSPEGIPHHRPSAGSRRTIASRLLHWLAAHGYADR